MTMQDIYDKVVLHLLSMRRGRARYNGSEVCAYLAENGEKCAVGVLIPACHQAQTFNGNVERLVREYDELAVDWGIEVGDDEDPTLMMLVELQRVHDKKSNWYQKHNGDVVLTRWALEAIQEIGAENNLSIPVELVERMQDVYAADTYSS
jgi:hypothetical protein